MHCIDMASSDAAFDRHFQQALPPGVQTAPAALAAATLAGEHPIGIYRPYRTIEDIEVKDS